MQLMFQKLKWFRQIEQIDANENQLMNLRKKILKFIKKKKFDENLKIDEKFFHHVNTTKPKSDSLHYKTSRLRKIKLIKLSSSHERTNGTKTNDAFDIGPIL